jgi:hypothetical protein
MKVEYDLIKLKARKNPYASKLKKPVTILATPWSEAFVRPNLEKLTAPDNTQKSFEPGACFAAGTLVRTKDGLVPIEQIKVGDWVLSKPENGAEQAYKRVIKTFAHAPEVVMAVGYTQPDDVNKGGGRLIATLNHPFWVAGKGWTAAGDLPRGVNADGSKLELSDGQHTFIRGSGLVYTSDQPGIGWSSSYMGDLQRPGYLWDYVNHRLVAIEVMAVQALQDFAEEFDHPIYEIPERFLLKLPVYNLEVEDFHTYYVGKHGVWVHNKTECAGAVLERSITHAQARARLDI